MSIITVLLADDSQIIREKVASFLKCDPEIQLVAEATSFAQTVQLANELSPQVILMDLHMHDEGTLHPSDFPSRLQNGTLVLAMSLWNDEETKALAADFGAVAFLDKTTLVSELIPAIRKHARNGKKMAAPEGSGSLANPPKDPS